MRSECENTRIASVDVQSKDVLVDVVDNDSNGKTIHIARHAITGNSLESEIWAEVTKIVE
jgi:hypothetical protein